MGYYIDQNGEYYGGDKQSPLDQDVPMRPSRFHEWDGADWVLYPSAAHPEVWRRIKAMRDARTKNGGFQVGSHWYHSDDKARAQQIDLALLGAAIPEGLQWKTMNGQFVTMTPSLAAQILAARAANDHAIFAAAQAHRLSMEASENPLEYDFSGGWPLTWEETGLLV